MSSDAISGDTAQMPVLIRQVLAGWAVGMFWGAPPPLGFPTPPHQCTSRHSVPTRGLPSCDMVKVQGSLAIPTKAFTLFGLMLVFFFTFKNSVFYGACQRQTSTLTVWGCIVGWDVRVVAAAMRGNGLGWHHLEQLKAWELTEWRE